MVRFSCFHSHIPSQKTKKQAQPPSETMVNNQFSSFNDLGSSQQSPSWEKRDCDSKNNVQSSQHPFLVGGGSKLGEMNTDTKNTRVSPVRQYRRSLSLGCNLNEEGRIYEENNSDDHTGLAFSRDGSHYQLNHGTTLDPKSPPATIDHEYASVEPLNLSYNELNNESIFSVGDQQYQEKEGADNYNNQVDAEVAIDSGIQTPRSLSMISKFHSLPNLPSMLSRSAICSPFTFSAYRSRSTEDFNVLSMMRKEIRVHNVSVRHSPGCNEDYCLFKSDKNAGKNGVPDGCDDSYSCAASNKDWIVPILDEEMYGVQNFHGESSSHQLDQLPNKDFKFKRIEDWVIDLQECRPVEENQEMDEMNEIHGPLDQGIAVSAAKVEANLNPSIQAAKKYISALSASATAAQLTNHGLVVVPFLSAFVTLKVVNLSGNSIVRITAGALPRGLHMLNLSKNKICTIEGLRELTRLRILDLSYNRITRIGHGLASCSSLKELYIAGNKISEVEGLHRLLKLSVLDLRFNKISTSKGFGQLAANYNSLQAISIEGNPAQKNVGDEQLKKHLQGLLPHLAYYNRQGIKSNSLKDSSERSVRLGMAAHQFDRGHKSDHKSIRRLTHGSTTLRQPSVKGQGVETPKRSRSKQVPPGGPRTPHHRHHHQVPLELNMKPLVVPDFAMKKSYSMGALNAH